MLTYCLGMLCRELCRYHDGFLLRIAIGEHQIFIDHRERGLRKGKIPRSGDADDAIARFLVDAHLAAHRDIVHPGAGS